MTFQFSQQENMSSRIVQPIIPSSWIIGTVNAQQDSTVVSARTNHGLNVNATADNSVLPTAGTPQSKRNSTSYVISGSHASTPAPHHNQAPHAEIKNYANSENSVSITLKVLCMIVLCSDSFHLHESTMKHELVLIMSFWFSRLHINSLFPLSWEVTESSTLNLMDVIIQSRKTATKQFTNRCHLLSNKMK